MMTEAEYLEYDRTHDGKYEYVNGEVVAMSGVSDAHDRIQVNATVALATRLRGGPCRVRGAALRVRLDETGLYGYPDLTIVCGEPAFAATRPVTLLNPPGHRRGPERDHRGVRPRGQGRALPAPRVGRSDPAHRLPAPDGRAPAAQSGRDLDLVGAHERHGRRARARGPARRTAFGRKAPQTNDQPAPGAVGSGPITASAVEIRRRVARPVIGDRDKA